MAKLMVIDTADVTVKRKSDGHLFASAETQMASLSQSLGIDEKIFGGIGNKALAVMKGQKEVTTTLRNAFYDSEFLAMTQGVEIASGNVTVYKRENELKVVDNSGSLEVTIAGTPVDATVTLINARGEMETAALTTNIAAVATGFAQEGEFVSATYREEVTGEIVEIDAEKFAEAYKMEYHTIAYDPATNKVVKDIYIQLDHVVPSGAFDISFENGSAMAPELTFEALAAPNSTKIGRIIEVDRLP